MGVYEVMAWVGLGTVALSSLWADRWPVRPGHDLKTRLLALLPTLALFGSVTALRFGDAPFSLLLGISIATAALWIWAMRNPLAIPTLFGGPWLASRAHDIAER
jgi:hypothetical protein